MCFCRLKCVFVYLSCRWRTRMKGCRALQMDKNRLWEKGEYGRTEKPFLSFPFSLLFPPFLSFLPCLSKCCMASQSQQALLPPPELLLLLLFPVFLSTCSYCFISDVAVPINNSAVPPLLRSLFEGVASSSVFTFASSSLSTVTGGKNVYLKNSCLTYLKGLSDIFVFLSYCFNVIEQKSALKMFMYCLEN